MESQFSEKQDAILQPKAIKRLFKEEEKEDGEGKIKEEEVEEEEVEEEKQREAEKGK